MMRSLTFIVIIICIHNVAATLVALHQKRTGEPESVYFDCGRFTFSEAILQKTAKKNAFQLAQQFRSLLYNLKQNYRTLDIPLNAYSSPTAYEMSHIIDVVSHMKNGHLIKCIRVDKSLPESSNIDLSREYSYECGHEIFSHDTIQSSITEAKFLMGKGIGYPSLYQGDLYRKELSYWIYPVLRKHNDYLFRGELDNRFFVIFTTIGEVIDIIAELMNGDYLKCTKTIKASGSTLDEDLNVGYLCGVEFFEVNHLKRTADLAKRKEKEFRRGKFPQKYYGPPLHKQQWIYPLLSNGKFYKGGYRSTNNYLVMDSSFKVLLTITMTKQVTKACEEYLRGLEIAPPESDNFKCKDVEFSNDALLTHVQVGCRSIGLNKSFPARYIGPPFNIPGPYLTWPLRKNKSYFKNPGHIRVVMNTECQLAGVIAMWKDEYYKCVRSKDNSVPGGNHQPVPIREELLHPLSDKPYSRKRKTLD